MNRLELISDNQFSGMTREEFKEFLISIGFDVEAIDGHCQICFGDPKNQHITTGRIYLPKENIFF